MSGYLIYLLTLRLVHIVAGVLWVGSAVFYLLFVTPAVKALGAAGPTFVQDLIERRRYPMFMNISSALTIVAGGLLFWHTSGGLQVGWLQSGPGIGFAIGSVLAIIVFGIGFFMIRPRAERLGALSKAIGMAGGPPAPAQRAELERLDSEMLRLERLDVALLTLALITMATARYWYV